MNSTDKLERWGYRNTASSAGKPERFEFKASDVDYIHSWHNFYGNPSYGLHFKDGSTLLLVDDYGAMNGLNSVRVTYVARKKDLI